MRNFVLATMILGLLIPALGVASPADAANCQFILGFQALHGLIPDVVGDCREDEHYNPANGDGLQATTGIGGAGGLLVWRKADNWTAYTDGSRTWINGPFGLEERANSQRFLWEDQLIAQQEVPESAGEQALCTTSSSSNPAVNQACRTAQLNVAFLRAYPNVALQLPLSAQGLAGAVSGFWHEAFVIYESSPVYASTIVQRSNGDRWTLNFASACPDVLGYAGQPVGSVWFGTFPGSGGEIVLPNGTACPVASASRI